MTREDKIQFVKKYAVYGRTRRMIAELHGTTSLYVAQVARGQRNNEAILDSLVEAASVEKIRLEKIREFLTSNLP